MGDCLYFVFPKSSKPHWMLWFTFNKKYKKMTLAKYTYLSLADDRTTVLLKMQHLRQGVNPLLEKRLIGEQITIEKFDVFLMVGIKVM